MSGEGLAASASAPPERASSALAGTRILLVLEHLELGGAERQALHLAEYLQRARGARAELLGIGPAGRAAAMAAERGVPCRSIDARPGRGRIALAGALLRVVRELRRARPDAVVSYTLVPNVLCALASPWSGARLTVWNQRDAGIGRVGRRIERTAARRAGAIVSNARSGAAWLTATLGVDPARIRLVPNAVAGDPPRRSREAWRRDLGLDDRAFVLCMVANLHDNKDHETLIRAAADAAGRWAAPERPPVLLLAGRDGGTRARLEALARGLGAAGLVRFLGPVDDVAGLLGAADLAVFSSRQEGCPNGVLEAMGAGLAIAGTDIDAIRDLVGTEGAALLAPPGDAPSLADRILGAAADPEARARLGEANRLRARENFGTARMGESMAAIIEEGLER